MIIGHLPQYGMMLLALQTTMSLSIIRTWKVAFDRSRKESVVGTGVANTTVNKFAAKVVVLGSLKLP